MSATSQRARRAMAIVAVVVGVFLLTVAPMLAQVSLDAVLVELAKVAKEKPQYGSGIALFGLFFPFWRAVGFIAGATLIAIAFALDRGDEWAWAVALWAHAIPAVSGMFMFLPYISWVKGFPIPMIISWVGLAGFWTTLLLYKSDRKTKLVNLLTYTFIGMLVTHSFTLGIGAQRMLMTRPNQPFFDGLEWWILTMTGEIDWIATAMLMLAIPLLALRKPAGWWLATIASLAVLLIDAPTQLIRPATLDYLWGTLLALGTLFLLIAPQCKKCLLEKPALPLAQPATI